MAASLRKKYNSKKKHTLNERNCGFELTFEQYCNLINRANVCDYTGVTLTENGKHIASIERIDASLPYRADNCCVVSRHVNSLKDSIEKGMNSSLKMEDIALVKKIKETLTNKTKEELTRKYTSENPDRPHSDVVLSEKYLAFSKSNSSHNLSFSKFKQLSARTTCSWTRRKFEKEDDMLKPILITTSDEFDDRNTIVVCKVIADIYRKDLFTKEQILRLVENI